MRENVETVGVSLGITRNLGNFNSLRLDAWASEPVREGEDKAEVYTRLWEIVEKELEEQIEKAELELEG